MRYLTTSIFGLAGVFLVMQSPEVLAKASDAAESACMLAVNSNYGGNVRNIDIVSSEFSEANSVVVMNADGERWRCLVSNDGDVQELTVQEGQGSGGYGSSSGSGGSFELAGRNSAHCKLINVEAGVQLYNGRCSIKESSSRSSSRIFEIKMGSADPYLFATSDGRNWMTGPEEVRFEDRGHTGIFRWADFRLEVDDS
ncbi:MAG: hypothetical protein V2I57_02490 [Xanthomonadales bacterium]|jgi:hypothetical protein|nr:hypothetical protein [Xanthomonadales bacterium]